ncbi:MAG: EamA family transporter [Treponema sp.]|jgi:multidrug transporter EmrE-like cation transporter|nr:EamA family transporter [Treponema sp.]
MKTILLIMASVSLNASAQLLMRTGMLNIGKINFFSSLLKILPNMLANVFLWLSLCCYGISIVTWMIVLSKVEVSFAYAFSSFGFILVTIMGAIFLKEQISTLRIIGIIIICIGVILVSRS